jgi:hypothetical protein
VTGSQQDTTSSLSHADQVARSRSTEDAILADQELLDAIGSTDFGNLLDNLRIVVATITTDDKESSLSTLRDGEQDAGDESFGVVGLLEDLDLFAKTRATMRDNQLIRSQYKGNKYCKVDQEVNTYVPGFWSAKGWMETVWTDMTLVCLGDNVG